MRVSPKFVVFFIASAIGMWALAGYLQSKDETLAGVKTFVARTEEITKVTGPQPGLTVHNSVFYQGVPGRDDPYREYRITAKGSQGTVDLIVRALQSNDQGAWSYQLRSINK